MISSFRISLVAGAVAMALGGTAMANTNLNATTTGDVFLNIIDTTNNTSFLFDTGISQASFNGAASGTPIDITSEVGTFLSAHASDSFLYSVVSVTKSGLNSVFDITGNTLPTPVSGNNNNQAQAPISQFLTAANAVASASSTSVVLPTGSDWGQVLTEGPVSFRLFGVQFAPYADSASLDTALPFYNIAGTNVTTLAGTWSLTTTLQGGTKDILAYTVAGGTPVPLPAPLLLLASGLSLMGVVSRRKKTEA